jgi:hypothetical protein
MKARRIVVFFSLLACFASATTLSVVAPPAAAIGAQFPRDFQWGVSTAAYQIEGAADLRQPVAWDAFANLSGKVFGNQNGTRSTERTRMSIGDCPSVSCAELDCLLDCHGSVCV